MDEIKKHVEAIRKIMEEKYGVDVCIDLGVHRVNEEKALEIAEDASMAFRTELLKLDRNGAYWYKTSSENLNAEVTCFYEVEEQKEVI